MTWFQQAAQHGLVDAQYNLGVVHAEGIGTSQDLVTALFWFEIAAKAGDTGAEQEVKNLRTRVSMSDALETSERVKDWKAKQPVALANGRFGAQRWNTGNPLQVKAVQTALGSTRQASERPRQRHTQQLGREQSRITDEVSSQRKPG